VANANSDTVTVIDTQAKNVKETVLVRPDPTFPYGSASDGIALSKDGQTLFVASGGNNAIAAIELPNGQHTNSLVQGFIPTDWYPGAVVADGNNLFVVNVKGLGTRDGAPNTTAWQIGAHLGTANKIPIPAAEPLSKYTAQVHEDGRIRQIRETQQLAQNGKPPVPVPLRVGEAWMGRIREAMPELPQARRARFIEFERHEIEQALAQCNGNKSRAADILQISRKTLYARLKRLNLDLQSSVLTAFRRPECEFWWGVYDAQFASPSGAFLD